LLLFKHHRSRLFSYSEDVWLTWPNIHYPLSSYLINQHHFHLLTAMWLTYHVTWKYDRHMPASQLIQTPVLFSSSSSHKLHSCTTTQTATNSHSLSRIQCHTWHTSQHFTDESFQLINCTGAHNQTHYNQQKIHKKLTLKISWSQCHY